MRILMLGWEFPPYISGGLGTACLGLTGALMRRKARVLFVLPRAIGTGEDTEIEDEQREYADTDALRVAAIPSELTSPYPAFTTNRPPETAEKVPSRTKRRGGQQADQPEASVRVVGVGSGDGYDGDLVAKIRRYTERCMRMTRREIFDVIHAHDWMTFPAGEQIARFSGRPLIVHVHATEFDRAGDEANGVIYDIERHAMLFADRVVTVSHRTRRTIIDRYGVPADRVDVIHNGIDLEGARESRPARPGRNVLFLGRVTMQKGPEYFVRAAARVAERRADVRFVVAGTGDQLPMVTRLARDLGIEDRFDFAGFLQGEKVEAAYRAADVYVMPSVSEPFGLTALEAARLGVPVILSKSSGAAEVLRRGSMKVDFWDTELMARMILAILDNSSLADALRRRAAEEIRGLTWDAAADTCMRLYYDLTAPVTLAPRDDRVPVEGVRPTARPKTRETQVLVPN